VNLFDSLFGVSSAAQHRRGGQNMNATTAKRAPRKLTKTPKITAEEQAYVETLPPKLRKLHMMLLPLRGKLTKAIAIK
jgi:hypothetical protein